MQNSKTAAHGSGVRYFPVCWGALNHWRWRGRKKSNERSFLAPESHSWKMGWISSSSSIYGCSQSGTYLHHQLEKTCVPLCRSRPSRRGVIEPNGMEKKGKGENYFSLPPHLYLAVVGAMTNDFSITRMTWVDYPPVIGMFRAVRSCVQTCPRSRRSSYQFVSLLTPRGKSFLHHLRLRRNRETKDFYGKKGGKFLFVSFSLCDWQQD